MQYYYPWYLSGISLAMAVRTWRYKSSSSSESIQRHHKLDNMGYMDCESNRCCNLINGKNQRSTGRHYDVLKTHVLKTYREITFCSSWTRMSLCLMSLFSFQIYACICLLSSMTSYSMLCLRKHFQKLNLEGLFSHLNLNNEPTVSKFFIYETFFQHKYWAPQTVIAWYSTLFADQDQHHEP